MAAAQTEISRKRKLSHLPTEQSPFSGDLLFEVPSDESGVTGSPNDSDDGRIESFPELDPGRDSEDDDDYSESEAGSEVETTAEDADDASDVGTHTFPQAKVITSDITGQPKLVYPEIEPDYDSDSSTEYAPNRVGNIPMHWYDDLPHIGYDMNGRKVLRPARGDELDKFLATVDDPSSWGTAFDKNAQTDKPLTAEELEIIRRLQANENPDAEYDPYEPTVEWFTGKGREEVMPLSAAPEPKRRWIPSKWEKQKIMKVIRAIRQGRIVPKKPKAASEEMRFYDLWSTPASSHPPPLPAPKPRLPTNSESYNPPPEYLPSETERTEWENQEKEDRERDYLPQKYSSFRLVPAYDQFVHQRFSRQLDLYLAPRVQRTKLQIDPNSLIPKLPSPSSLKPFPHYLSLQFSHQGKRVRCISTSPDAAWVVSADEDGFVSLWETLVGKEVHRWKMDGAVGAIEWCPRSDVAFFVVGIENQLRCIIPPNLSTTLLNATRSFLMPTNMPTQSTTVSPVKWVSKPSSESSEDDTSLIINLPPMSGTPKQISWHRRGDYFASVCATESNTNVWIHQVTRRHSQAPFRRIKGSVQLVLFHPSKPHFFVATQQYVRLYNLAEQKLLKTLTPGIKWISSMDVHPSGDHLIVGGYDRKLCWFDLDLSSKPYKVLRYHNRAIRSLQFHPTYPLFASSSDDGTIQIFHARVYNDLMTDPLIVPLKILRGHDVKDGLGVLQVRWCSGQPWLVSAGADSSVVVWSS